jgi:hypothetical protein
MPLASTAMAPLRQPLRAHHPAGTILVLIIGAAGALPAQRAHEVYGTVVDATSAAPIPYVEVWLVRRERIVTDKHTLTDLDGRFALRAEGTGPFALYTRRLGYSPVVTPLDELRDLDSLAVSIRLAPLPVELPEATVIGRAERRRDLLLAGFDRRRSLGLGAFLTYDEIQQKGAPPLPDLLGEIPGVTIRRSGTHIEVQMARALELRRCEPLIYLDGQRATHSTDPPYIVEELLTGTPGTVLEAVEVYRGRSELPAEFADPDARCGVIVLWTRRPDLHVPPPNPKQ